MRRALAVIGAAVLLVLTGCSLVDQVAVPSDHLVILRWVSSVASTAARTSCMSARMVLRCWFLASRPPGG
jgi:hypothetical protein